MTALKIPRGQRMMVAPKRKRTQDYWYAVHLADKLSVHVCSLHPEEPIDTETVTTMSPTPDEWWELAERLAGQFGTIWVVGWQMAKVIDYLQVWPRLNAGKIDLPWTVHARDHGPLGEHIRRYTGRCAISPRVIDLEVMVGLQRLRFLDLSNWNVQMSHWGKTPSTCTITDTATAVHALRNLVHAWSLGSNAPTAAAQGWSAWRFSTLTHQPCYHSHPEVRALERAACYGGRCEPYRLGPIDEIVHYVDVRSCYLSIAEYAHFPISLEAVHDHPSVEEFGGLSLAQRTLADVILDTADPDYPMGCVGDAVYPVGRFRTTLAGPELSHAIARRRVVRILRAQTYRCAPVWSRFAAHMRCVRKWAADMELPEMLPSIKAMTNGAFGYAARHDYRWVPYHCDLPGKWWYGWVSDRRVQDESIQMRRLGGQTERLDDRREPVEAYPAMFAWMTSSARVKLNHLMTLANPRNVYYCDTDGLIVNEEGLNMLEETTELWGDEPGDLSVRASGKNAYVSAKKVYRVGDTIVAAGCPPGKLSTMKLGVRHPVYWGHLLSNGQVIPYRADCDDVGDMTEHWDTTLYTRGLGE
jgi:hypothetical protein